VKRGGYMEQAAQESTTQYAPLDVRKTVPWIVFLVFFGVLHEPVFNVSTPAIAREYGLNPSGVSWVMTTFIIFFGIGSVIYGRLSDIFSLKRLIVLGVCIYVAGSIAGFALHAYYPAVIASRAVQGAGASAIPALIMVVVARFFPPAERGKVFGAITSTVAFAAGVGPVVGGFISGSLHWTFLFLIPVFTLISIPFFLTVLPKEETRKGSVDVLGAFLIAAGVGALILFLSFTAWYFIAASAVAFAAFVIRIRRVERPFIEPSLFRNRRFVGGMVVAFIVFCVGIGVIFVVPLMLNSLRGLSTREIGLIMFPGAISGVVFGTLGGRMADKRGNRLVVVLGLGLIVLSLLAAAVILGFSPWFLAGTLLLTYIGFSLIQTALVNSVSQMLPVEETGVGMGLFNLVTFISGAFGTAIVARVLGSRWLDLRIIPIGSEGRVFPYSNLMLVFVVLLVVAALVYFRSQRKEPGEADRSA
jgi:MFS transporter, DHA2 family, metal-tetracycline-proton antiporter